jgi:oligoribonuclease
MTKRENLIWIDLEMSGLDPKKERILEIATIVTNSELDIIAEGPNLIIHQSPRVLNQMDEWNTKQHHKSGLVERVKESRVSVKEAELQTLAFLEKHTKIGQSPMCGNTIYHDRKFLLRWMPKLEKYFHYRLIDVSTIKELVNRWSRDISKEFDKKTSHRALSDIHDSIEELRFYRNKVFCI